MPVTLKSGNTAGAMREATYNHRMSEIDRETYEDWRQWETKRRSLTHDVLKRTLGNAWPAQEEIPAYDEWLARGKAGEVGIKRALAAFFGRYDLDDEPRIM